MISWFLIAYVLFNWNWLSASPDGDRDLHLSVCFVQQKKLIRIVELLLLHSGCCSYTCCQILGQFITEIQLLAFKRLCQAHRSLLYKLTRLAWDLGSERDCCSRIKNANSLPHICVFQVSCCMSTLCTCLPAMFLLFPASGQSQLFASPHSVLLTSALSHCVQARNIAKGEWKRYSRRQVRCNFNLKPKALSQLVSN